MTPIDLKNILRLQELDLTLLQLKREAQAVPERKERAENRLREAAAERDAVKQSLKDLESQIRAAEGDVEAVHEKVRRYRVQQMEVKSNEAFKALEHEISACDAEISAAEEKVLVWMEQQEPLETDVREAEAKYAQAGEAVARELQGLEDRMAVIRAQFDELKASREAVAAKVDPEILKRYLNHLSAKQDAFVVPAKQQTCGGCHMKLSPQTLHDLHAAVKWTTCTFCSRLLYDPVLVGDVS